ncbi:hypothetical protein P8452_55505 [Trifolium repens]|nr:hypothetical protein P8452_55505 [Trifolium repens]
MSTLLSKSSPPSDSIDGARSTLTGESSTAAPATTFPSITFSVPPPSRVCCFGRGKNGSLCVLRQSIRLEVISELKGPKEHASVSSNGTGVASLSSKSGIEVSEDEISRLSSLWMPFDFVLPRLGVPFRDGD